MARKLQVEIVGDASSLQKAFGKASGASTGLGSKLGKLGKVAALGLGGLTVGAAAAGKKMVDLASDAAEVQSKLEVTFGKSLPGLTAEIDKFSAATGTSRFEMREQAANMGALLAPMLGSKSAAADMSLQFTKLATDLGSFNNIPTGEALEKIRAGLVGESEPLRSLGVLLTEASTKEYAYANGIAKRGAELTEVQKVEARAGQIMAQTALAQGDATRTAGSMANQMKALKSNVSDAATEIGMALIPYALAAVQAFNAHWPKIKQVVGDVLGTIISGVQSFVGFIQRHWDTIRTATTTAFNAVRTAAETAWPRVQDAAEKVVAWYRGTLQPTITSVINTLRVIWDRFGADITRIAQTAFNTAVTVIRNAMTIIKAVIEGVLAVLRGDWSAAWNSLKTIVSTTLSSIAAIIRGFASIALTAATAIGRAIVDGVVAGASGLLGALKDKLMGGIQGAMDAVKSGFGIFSPSKVFADQIGKPLGEGVLEGYVFGSRDLPEKMKESIRRAIEAARAQVEAMRGRLSTVWSTLASDALAAFDAIKDGVQTRSEKILDAERAKRQAAEYKAAIEEARADLAAAETPEEKAAAQKRLDDAVWAQREAALQERAAQERRELDARNALQRRHFEERFAALEAEAAREGMSRKEFHARLMKLYAAFGIDYKKSGAALGHAFAEGMREAENAVAKAAEALAKVAESRLRLRSPAKEGPLSEIDTWWKPFGKTLTSSVGSGQVAHGIDSALNAAAPAGGGQITVNFPNYLGSRQEVEDWMIRTLQRSAKIGNPGIA